MWVRRVFDQFNTEMGNMVKFGEILFALQAIERSKVVSSSGSAAK